MFKVLYRGCGRARSHGGEPRPNRFRHLWLCKNVYPSSWFSECRCLRPTIRRSQSQERQPTRYAPLQNYIRFLPYLQRLFLNDVPLPRSLSLPRGLVTQSTSGRFAALSQHFPVPVLLLPLRPSESCGPVPTHLPTNPKM